MQHLDLDDLRRRVGTFDSPTESGTPAETDPVLGACHRVLADRQVTAAELRRKLSSFSPAEVDHAIERCQAAGLLDDERYAESYVESRMRRGHGALRIRHDLLRRGIDRATIDAQLARLEQSDALADAALDAARRKFARLQLDESAERARVVRWLAGRGYTSSQAHATLERLRQERAGSES